MSFIGSSVGNESIVSDEVREGARRRGEELLGGTLIVIAAMIAATLATWSVLDPSLNHATESFPQNFLGYPGAILSDLLMQMFGLAAPLLVWPLVHWGWKILRHRPIARFGRRIFSAAIAITAASIFAAGLPAPLTWPLPTGLGGFFGAWLWHLPHGISSGNPTLFAQLLTGMVTLILTLVAISYALEINLRAILDRQGDPLDDLEIEDDVPEYYDDEEDGHVNFLGAISHFGLSLRARVQRIIFPRRLGALDPKLSAARAPLWRRLFSPRSWFSQKSRTDNSYGGFAYRGDRIEPVFEEGYNTASYQDRENYADYSDAPGYNAHTHVPPGETERVAAPKARPKTGKRLGKEAQPSLLPRREFQLPPLRLLTQPAKSPRGSRVNKESLEQNARMLEGVLEDYGIRGEIINVRPGPVVTLYELEPAPGIKSSRVIGLADDIARSMSAISARIAVIPGKNAIGIELPNANREMVYLRELLASENFETSKAKLPLVLGKTIGGEAVIADLARMPHLLIAGTTGSGKSVGINSMILSLLYRLPPDKCKMIMVDPKMLELSVYDGIPHLLTPVVTDPKKAVVALKWTVREMEERYKNMSRLGVRNVEGFNTRVIEAKNSGEIISRTVQTGFDKETGQAVYESEEMELEPMPYIVVVIDEMADLMMVAGKDIEGTVQRLAQMARAAGIHIVTATQRPSVDVITGTIKANFPTRISFQVTSKIDSRTILGEMGAEQLLGQGDMLHMAGGGRISRVHGPFVSDDEVEKIVNHLKKQGVPQYLEEITVESEEGGGEAFGVPGSDNDSDDIYQRALHIVLTDRKASTSYIQRRLSIGYNRAATIIERLEGDGVVSPANHAGKREILIGEDPI